MTSLAELPDLIGFFSYSRQDDEYSDGALSRLRDRILKELRTQLGRRIRVWQDTEAIPDGSDWSNEINRGIAESAFFIPIVTPSALASKHCRSEFEAFLAREADLGRNNLVFPLVYVRVPALENEGSWKHDELLRIIGTRQYADLTRFRQRGLDDVEVRERIERYCSHIVDALREPWISPDERRARAAAEALRIADEMRRAAEEARRSEAEIEAQRLAEAHERARALDARRKAEAKKRGAEIKRTAEAGAPPASEKIAAASSDTDQGVSTPSGATQLPPLLIRVLAVAALVAAVGLLLIYANSVSTNLP
jgi:TIR domain